MNKCRTFNPVFFSMPVLTSRTFGAIDVYQCSVLKTFKQISSFPEGKKQWATYANSRAQHFSPSSRACSLHFLHPEWDGSKSIKFEPLNIKLIHYKVSWAHTHQSKTAMMNVKLGITLLNALATVGEVYLYVICLKAHKASKKFNSHKCMNSQSYFFTFQLHKQKGLTKSSQWDDVKPQILFDWVPSQEQFSWGY